LQLIEKNILRYPVLYLSAFFEKNKGNYYDSLTMVRASDNIEQWIKFFLNGVIESAKSSKKTFEKIIQLRQEYDKKIISLGRKAKMAQELLSFLFSHPSIDAKIAMKKLNITYNTANKLLEGLEKIGILEEITGFSRNRLFRLYEYVDLFKN
jgi:Fic family protein